MPDATPQTLEFVLEFGEPIASPHVEVSPVVFGTELAGGIYLGIDMMRTGRPAVVRTRIAARPRITATQPGSVAVFPVPLRFAVKAPEATRPTVPFQTLWVGVDTESLTAALAVT